MFLVVSLCHDVICNRRTPGSGGKSKTKSRIRANSCNSCQTLCVFASPRLCAKKSECHCPCGSHRYQRSINLFVCPNSALRACPALSKTAPSPRPSPPRGRGGSSSRVLKMWRLWIGGRFKRSMRKCFGEGFQPLGDHGAANQSKLSGCGLWAFCHLRLLKFGAADGLGFCSEPAGIDARELRAKK